MDSLLLSKLRPSPPKGNGMSGHELNAAIACAAMLNWRWVQTRWWAGWMLVVTSGCAGLAERKTAYERPFVFGADTFAYRNDLTWIYYVDPVTGKFKHRDREPKPDYKQHCFVVARSARQFFQHARFEPGQPALDEAAYRQLVRQ